MTHKSGTASQPLPPEMLFNIIGEAVPLRPFGCDGDRQYGACPFHPAPIMSLYAHSSGWYCFACHAGGGAVEWIMRRNMVDRDAARTLLQQYLGRLQ